MSMSLAVALSTLLLISMRLDCAAQSDAIRVARVLFTADQSTANPGVTVPWNPVFPDTNYTAVCTVEVPPSDFLLPVIQLRSAESMTVNPEGGGPGGILNCIAVPDSGSSDDANLRHAKVPFSSTPVTVTWGSSFPDTNYTAVCTLESNGANEQTGVIDAVLPDSIGVTSDHPGTMHCIAVPDSDSTLVRHARVPVGSYVPTLAILWGVPFPDNNYAAVCSDEVDGSSGSDSAIAIDAGSRTPGSMSVIPEISAGTVHCIAIPSQCDGNVSLSLGNPVGNYQTSMNAVFTPSHGLTLSNAATICGVEGFNWQQTIEIWPTPTNLSACNFLATPQFCLVAITDPTTALTAPPAFLDPVPGGYTYQLPGGDNSYPFYFSPAQLPSFETTSTLRFVDTPSYPELPIGQYMEFKTDLVGVLPGNIPGPVLFEWTWASDFNGTSGGVATSKNLRPPDPGSGTGGITVTSINGVQLPPVVPPSQVATTASGLAYSRATQTFNGTVTLKNISGSAINGPLQIVFFGLPVNVTLANATRSLSGTPYLTVPALASLAPGQSVNVSLRFKNPSNAKINFTPVIYSGSIN